MDYFNKAKKEPQLFLAAANILMLFLPWVKYDFGNLFGGWGGNLFGSDVFDEASQTIIGFSLFKGSFLMVLLLLIPGLMIATLFIKQFENNRKVVFLCGALLGILFTIILTPLAARGGSGLIDIDRHIGFWLTLLSYIAILVITLLFNYNFMKSIKENGFGKALDELIKQITNSFKELIASFKSSNPNTAPNQQGPDQQFPNQQAPYQQAPYQQAPNQQAPYQQAPNQQAPYQQTPAQQVPYQQAPNQQAPVQQFSNQQAPVQQAPVAPIPAQPAPKFCRQCGSPIPTDSQFCTQCGSKTE